VRVLVPCKFKFFRAVYQSVTCVHSSFTHLLQGEWTLRKEAGRNAVANLMKEEATTSNQHGGVCYNPCYSGGRGRRIVRSVRAKLTRPYLRNEI
jgi:hypothetical protein